MITEIIGKEISLVALKQEFIEDIYAYASDYENTKFMSWPTHTSLEDTKGFIHYTIEMYKRGHHYDWAVYHNKDKKVIGTCGLPDYENTKDSVEIGYILSKNYWNQGHGTGIVNMLVRFGFKTLHLKNIKAYCDIENKASQRVLEKNHFTFQGIVKYKLIKQEEPVDSKEYIISYSNSK